jgi:drug/metabolite transporter (DMT)-like permease
MFKGSVFLIIATCVWGGVFLSPRFFPSFTALEIAYGRYIAFGLWSLLLFLKERQKFPKITRRQWGSAFAFAFSSNYFFYTLILTAFIIGGPIQGSLLIALFPLITSLYSNLVHRTFPFKLLLIPILVCLIGISFLNVGNILYHGGDAETKLMNKFLAALFALMAMGAWAWYGAHNSKFLNNNPHISSDHWSTAIGLASLTIGVFLAPICFFLPKEYFAFNNIFSVPHCIDFLSCSIILGIFFTRVPLLLWNKGAKLLPASLAGLFIILESVSSLIYQFLFDKRLPYWWESIGIVVCVSGVVIGLFRVKKYLAESNIVETV